MKRLFLLSTVILLAACGNSNNTASPATSSTTTSEQFTTKAASLKTISSSKNNVAVKTNTKWIQISQNDDVDLELAGHTQKAYIGLKTIDKTDTIAMNLDDVAQIAFEGSTTHMKYDKALDIKTDTIANMPARYAQFEYTYEGTTLEVLLYMIENSDNYTYVVSTSEKSIYPQIAEEIKSIINSIHKP